MKADRDGWRLDRDAERTRWVNRYRSSGLGLKRFAAQLHYWVYGLDQPRKPESPTPVFQEVRLPSALRAAAHWNAEVGLPNGTMVRLVAGTDMAWSVAVVESLRRSCSP